MLTIWVAADAQVRDTEFSTDRGYFDEPFTVMVSSKTDGAHIYYTVDGSAPSPENGLGGPSPQSVRIESTTVLRAIAIVDGMEPSNVDTQTYIFPEHVLEQPRAVFGYPTPRMRAGPTGMVALDYEMDPELLATTAAREEALRGLRSIPTMSIALEKDYLFGEGGIYYATDGNGPTHAASVEVLYPAEPGRSFQTDCGLESHATVAIKRSFKLKFQSEHGPGKLRSGFFRRSPLNGESATRVIDRIVLRAGNERSFAIRGYPDKTAYTRDQWVRDSQIAMSGVGSHGTFVHLFLNGLYWGLYNAVERPDAWFTSAYGGGEHTDWYSVNHGGTVSGDPSRWDKVRTELKDKDLRVAANYDEMAEYLDLVQFADYLILAFHAGFADWPFNNWYGGNRNNPPTRFQFFVWDAELSWIDNRRRDGARRDPRFAWNIQEHFRSSLDLKGETMVGVWHALRKNDDFMMLFADRVHNHCFGDGALSDENSIDRWDALNTFVADAIVLESARWGDARESLGEHTRTRENTFEPEIERVISMMDGAAERFIDTLRREGYYPSIDPPEIGMSEPTLFRGSRLSFDSLDEGSEIYFTTDGSDPRARGGGVNTAAEAFDPDAPSALDEAVTVRARVRRGGAWSALEEKRLEPKSWLDSLLGR